MKDDTDCYSAGRGSPMNDALTKLFVDLLVDILFDELDKAPSKEEKKEPEIKESILKENAPPVGGYKTSISMKDYEDKVSDPKSQSNKASKHRPYIDSTIKRYGPGILYAIDANIDDILEDPLTMCNVMDALARGAIRLGYYEVPPKYKRD